MDRQAKYKRPPFNSCVLDQWQWGSRCGMGRVPGVAIPSPLAAVLVPVSPEWQRRGGPGWRRSGQISTLKVSDNVSSCLAAACCCSPAA